MTRPSVARPTDAPSSAQRPGPRGGAERAAETADEAAGVEQSPASRDDLGLQPEELPRHVAIIMDGNRRWARIHGVSELEGHAAGVEAVRGLLRHAVDRGIPVISLYAFSRENWARTDDEVSGLFRLLEDSIARETEGLRAEGVRVRLLGRIGELPDGTQQSIGSALDATSGGWRLLLNIAFNYAGRTEIVDAVRSIVARGLRPDEIDEETIAAALYTAGLPDPDLVIRTGGEQRLSNFLIWQSAYAEFCSSPVLWPDFGAEAFDAALLEFASRNRRFGR